jgi:hypothetical protein
VFFKFKKNLDKDDFESEVVFFKNDSKSEVVFLKNDSHKKNRL